MVSNILLVFFLLLHLCFLNASATDQSEELKSSSFSLTLKPFIWNDSPFVKIDACKTWWEIVQASKMSEKDIQTVIKLFRKGKSIKDISKDSTLVCPVGSKDDCIRSIIYIHYELYGFTAMDVVMQDVCRLEEAKKILRKRRGCDVARKARRQHLVVDINVVPQLATPSSSEKDADLLYCDEKLEDSPRITPLLSAFDSGDECDKEVAKINAFAITRDGCPFSFMLDQ